MPIEFAAEAGAPSRIELGVTMTAHLPLRATFKFASNVPIRRGTSDGVQQEARSVNEEEAAQIEKDIRSMIQSWKRNESVAPERPA